MKSFDFRTHGRIGREGRLGEMLTPHGTVATPVFMPVGTKASVKSLSPADLSSVGAQIILGNTYHLHLRPGENIVEEFGGLHKFMGWNGAILTDSGGFQVSSLGKQNQNTGEVKDDLALSRVTNEGVEFKSHIDGSKHFFTPEKSIEIQESLGADIIMAFDECTPNTDEDYSRMAMERTHQWLVRSKRRWLDLEKEKATNGKPLQALFGIIQGGKNKKLRRESAKFIVEQDLPGIAFGGEAIGSDPGETAQTISWVLDILPLEKPRYAMGVGVRPSDLISVVEAGADMFDCVAPTRLARCGLLYHPEELSERIDINKSKFVHDKNVIWETCDCYTCTEGFTRGYLHHLLRSKELLYYRLASIHNLRIMIRTIERLRSGSGLL